MKSRKRRTGTGGAIIKTTDGGLTWSEQEPPLNNNLYDISAVNADVAWAVGYEGALLKTTDGGAT